MEMWNFFGEVKNSIHELVDEIYVKPQVVYKNGKLEGLSATDINKKASTVQTFMVTSVLSKNKDVVGLFPVQNLNAEYLKDLIIKIIEQLSQVGYIILTLISDNNKVNKKAFDLLCGGEMQIDYIDIDFTLWLSWMLAPLLITFLLPLMIVILLYFTALILYIYKLHWHTLRRTYDTEGKWDAARKTAAAIWDAHGWIWHGYEVRGLENIPNEQPVLFIYYHGAIPIDLYYFLAKVLLYQNRLIHTVADYFLFKIPGFPIISECMKVVPGTIQTCSNILKEGNLLAISPGGVYESQFSQQYNIMWKKRLGFAKVALDAKVTIIPLFTENVREAFRAVTIGRRIFLKLYALTKIPLAPIYGGFPVKMITHVGKPIIYDSTLTPEQLQSRVALAINELIKQNQRLPGNIMHALLDRIPCCKERHKSKDSEKHNE